LLFKRHVRLPGRASYGDRRFPQETRVDYQVISADKLIDFANIRIIYRLVEIIKQKLPSMFKVVCRDYFRRLDAGNAYAVKNSKGIVTAHSQSFQFRAFPYIINDVAFSDKYVLLSCHLEFCLHHSFSLFKPGSQQSEANASFAGMTAPFKVSA
jgi:hypothetical protein